MVSSRISEDMSTAPPSARWLVRELVEHARGRSTNSDDAAGVAFEACERTYRDLSRELGTMSAQALVNRAQAQAALEHPALLSVRLYRQRDSVAAADSVSRQSDCTATAEDFEALLETLLALIGRFVGINIVIRLLAPLVNSDSPPAEDAR